LIAELDPKTGNVKTENPDFLKSGSAAIVQVKPTKPMVIEEIKILPQLGRFAVRDMGATVAAGMVQSIQKA
jgi:elongation factor 1-alpha